MRGNSSTWTSSKLRSSWPNITIRLMVWDQIPKQYILVQSGPLVSISIIMFDGIQFVAYIQANCFHCITFFCLFHSMTLINVVFYQLSLALLARGGVDLNWTLLDRAQTFNILLWKAFLTSYTSYSGQTNGFVSGLRRVRWELVLMHVNMANVWRACPATDSHTRIAWTKLAHKQIETGRGNSASQGFKL